MFILTHWLVPVSVFREQSESPSIKPWAPTDALAQSDFEIHSVFNGHQGKHRALSKWMNEKKKIYL